MSSVPSPAQNSADIPGLEPAPAPIRPPRQALGLPAGSVRALLALLVLGLIWLIVLLHHDGEPIPRVFVFLQYLLIMALASYFAAHGKNIGTPREGASHPLHLPRGTIRFVLLTGFIGLILWIYWRGADFGNQLTVPGYTPLVLLAGFLLGFLLTCAMHAVFSNGLPILYQDLLAWVSLIAALLLGVAFLLHFINLSLSAEMQMSLMGFECVLAAVVGFYFGARS